MRAIFVVIALLLTTTPALAFRAGDPRFEGQYQKSPMQVIEERKAQAAQDIIRAAQQDPSIALPPSTDKLLTLKGADNSPKPYWDGRRWSRYFYEQAKYEAAQTWGSVMAMKTRFGLPYGATGNLIESGATFQSRVGQDQFMTFMHSNGGSYSPLNGSGTFNANGGRVYTFFDDLIVSVEYPQGSYMVNIDFQNDIMTVRGAGGHVAVNPIIGEFVDANLPLMAQASSQLLTNTGRGVSFTENATLRVLNDVYAVVGQQKGDPDSESWPLQDFVFAVMQTDQMRQRVFAMAQKIYAD